MNRYQLAGKLVYYLSSLLRKTLTIQIITHPEYNNHTPYLFAFWHGKQLLPVLELNTHQTKRVVLVSPSKDGDILSAWLEKLGFETIRGSSRKDNIKALAIMMRKLKSGYSIGYGIDGPIGPIYKVKPGMTHMAQKYGIDIIPVGSAFTRKWIFNKAWDKYEVPKPFSKAILYLGKPFHVSAGMELDAANLELEHKINEVEQQAEISCNPA